MRRPICYQSRLIIVFVVLIEPIRLPVPGVEQMQAEARAEGHKFLDTLLDEWMSGKNRFDGAGETLLGHLDQGTLVAVGGLNCDPFLGDPRVGRIRRLYVRPAWRDKGIGEALFRNLISAARWNFSCVRLRADNPRAARLYERNGFSIIGNESATHMLRFD
jgi:GNAT superfamily N-acetyltransferase